MYPPQFIYLFLQPHLLLLLFPDLSVLADSAVIHEPNWDCVNPLELANSSLNRNLRGIMNAKGKLMHMVTVTHNQVLLVLSYKIDLLQHQLVLMLSSGLPGIF